MTTGAESVDKHAALKANPDIDQFARAAFPGRFVQLTGQKQKLNPRHRLISLAKGWLPDYWDVPD